MKLDLVIPRNWEQQPAADGRRVAVAPATVVGDVSITTLPIVPLPTDVAGWRDALIAAQTSTGHTQRIVARANLFSVVGWRLNVFDLDVLRDEVVVARQLHVVYYLLEYGCLTLASVGEPDAYPALRDELLKVLASGRPRWNSDGEVVALSQVWNPSG